MSLLTVVVSVLPCLSTEEIWPTEAWPVSTPAEQTVDGTVLNAIHEEILGGDFGHVVKLNIYLTDMSGQDVLNEISARHFDPANPPPRTLVGVTELAHPKMLVEIEGMAALPLEA